MKLRRILLCVPLISAGCYSYVPTSLDAVRAGDEVRMRISGAEADRLEALRFTDARALEGEIASIVPNRVYIDAIIRVVDPLGITSTHTQRLDIPLSEVQSLEYRRLDALKSAAAVGGTAFVLGAAAYAVLVLDLGRTNDFEDPELRAPTLRIPLLRFTR
jgi:hypothetical protein